MDALLRLVTARPFPFALLAGAFAGLGQAPVSQPWITLLALLLWCWLHTSADASRRAAWIGWGFGLGYFGLTLHWILEPFFVDAAAHAWMAPFALAGMSSGMALFWALASRAAWRLGSTRFQRAVSWAVFLAFAELIRSYILTGFPWALIGHVWVGWWPMQMAAWIGPHGLTLWTLMLAALPLAVRGRLALRLAAVSGLVALSLAAFLSAPQPGAPTGKVVRLVQPNAPQHLKWHPEHARAFFDRAVDFSATGEARPDLIIWPETSIPALLEHAGVALGIVRDAADGVPVVVGIQRRVLEDYHNSLIVLSAEGEITDVYDKFHLVPFGEYMPASWFFSRFGILGLASRAEGGYTPGPGGQLLDLGPLGKALPLICYEAIFPQHSRSAERPDWLMQITNDAWFGNWVGPYQHLAQARLRAVEQGLPMVRVANTGVSAVITPRGNIVADLPLNTEGYLDVPLPNPSGATLYARTGDWLAIAVLLVVFSWLGYAKVRNRH